MAIFEVGSQVAWKWMGGKVKGEVRQIFTETIVMEIKGKNIKRLGTVKNPAYLVISKAGNYALKLETELIPL